MHDITRYLTIFTILNSIAKTPRDNKNGTHKVLSNGIHRFSVGAILVIPPRTEAAGAIAPAFVLRTVHRTVFYTPEQFSKRSLPIWDYFDMQKALLRQSFQLADKGIRTVILTKSFGQAFSKACAVKGA